ncbi:hypothetical protein GQ457_11G006340 [Hibiscus cannabinus]
MVKTPTNPRKVRPQCSHCGLLGHIKERCYKLHGYPPGYRSKNLVNSSVNNAHTNAIMDPPTESLTSQQCQQLIAMLTNQLQAASTSGVHSTTVNLAMQGKILSFVNSLSSFNVKNSWIIDSGASRHVCYSKDLFESLAPLSAGTILLPNKTIVTVNYAGTIRLSDRILLRDVLYVPEFRFNLLAVSSLIKDTDLTVLFTKSHCLIQDLCQVIGNGEFFQGLYLLQLPRLPANLSTNESFALASWHDRLGHPSSSVFRFLKDVLPSVECNKNDLCTICPLAKQKHLSFPVSSTITNAPFELVHCDIWGPYRTQTYDNYRYFLTIVDDYSRSTWTYLLKQKSDVISIIPSFIAMIKRQYGFDLKVFRSDNAPELRFSELFSTLGILHQFSCVETPQQNSVVERKHQHLLAVARALFFQARVPTRFWGDCVLTATYVINRLPSKVLDGKSPYELLNSCMPSYSHLKVFGCLCFVSTLKASRDKFTERALAGVFIGYAPGTKGYKVYILQTHTIVVSRNVIFHEGDFPFHSVVPADVLIDPFPDVVLPHVIHDVSHNQNLQESTTSLPEFRSSTNATNSSQESTGADNVNTDNDVHTANDADSAGADTVHDIDGADSAANVHDVEDTNAAVDRMVPEVIPVVRRSSRTVDYTAFISNISSSLEPVFYHQTVRFSEWRDAMQDELRAMDSLNTWSVVSLPDGKKAIDCKWVYRIKRKADGSIDRYKARLVAKGFTQVEGVDYTHTFSPVAKMTSFKLLLALAAVNDWHMLQLDVNNAFLNGMLDEEVYMKLPLGYKTEVSGDNLVCKLHKSICGLKQASRQWFHAFSQVVLRFGFSQSPHEHSLFVKGSGDSMVALLVYVDDIILAGKDLKLLAEVQTFLQSSFKLKELDNLKLFLGFEIARNKTGILLSQRQYALQLLEDTGSLAKKPTELPLVSPHKLSKDDGELLADPQLYRRMVGRLLYLTHTRPDITYAVNLLSQFVSSPRAPHLQVVYHLLSYIKGSPGLGLFFSSTSNLKLTAFVDSDYNSCPDTRRSTIGYCTFLGNTLLSWKSKKQHTVSRSSCEAEYRAMATAACELVWIAALLSSFQIHVPQTFLYCDSQSAIHLATNQVFHERTKHIEVDCHFVRDKVNSGFLRLFHVCSHDQIADFFTKALHVPAFRSFLAKLGLLNIHCLPS